MAAVLLIVALGAVAVSATPLLAASPLPDPTPTEHIISREVTVIDGDESHSDVRPGDWLLIRAGKRESLTLRNLKGEPGAPIVIVNDGGQVNIQAEGWVGLSIENSQHIRVTGTGHAGIEYGFEITGFTNTGLSAQQGTEHVEIDHLEIYHSGTASVAGMRVHSTEDQVSKDWVQHDTYIHHNYIHDVGSSAMYVGKADSQGGTPLHGLEIAYNRAERCGMDAYQVRNGQQRIEVHHNYAEDIGWRMLENPGQQGAGLAIESGTGGQWHDNVIINANTGAELVHHLAGTKVFGNLFVHCGYVNDGGAIRQFTKQPVSIHHNTIVDSKTYGIDVKDNVTRGEIRDNFIVQSGQVHISAAVPQRHNVTVRRIRRAMFVAPWEGDYSLLWGSPARQAGSDGGDVGAFPYRAKYVIPPRIEMTGWE